MPTPGNAVYCACMSAFSAATMCEIYVVNSLKCQDVLDLRVHKHAKTCLMCAVTDVPRRAYAMTCMIYAFNNMPELACLLSLICQDVLDFIRIAEMPGRADFGLHSDDRNG